MQIAVGLFLKFQTAALKGSKFFGPLRDLLGHTSLLFSFFSNLMVLIIHALALPEHILDDNLRCVIRETSLLGGKC